MTSDHGRDKRRGYRILAGVIAAAGCLLALLLIPQTGLIAALSMGGADHTDASPSATTNPYCRSQPERDLPPLDVSDMRLWNFDAAWHASQWQNNFSFTPWRSDHVTVEPNGDVALRLDRSGAPQLKSGNRIPMADKGTWEVEVTLPAMREGMVVAPLWLYNEERQEEIDFEFAGTKSLDLSLHGYPDGEHRQTAVSVFEGMDLSNCTAHFKIVADASAGWAALYVEDHLVHRFTEEEAGYFVTGKLRPIIEMWAARDDHRGFVQWLGQWQPLPNGEVLTMVVHGYRFSPNIDGHQAEASGL